MESDCGLQSSIYLPGFMADDDDDDDVVHAQGPASPAHLEPGCMATFQLILWNPI